MSKGILLFVVNTTGFFLSHRLPIAQAAKRAGYDIHVATASSESQVELANYGFSHHLIPISRSGVNLFHEIRDLWAMVKLMRDLKPSIVHLVTIKPVLYGGMAARFNKIPGVVAAISGLGMLFTSGGPKKKLIRTLVSHLYGFALNHRNLKVVFQNNHDLEVISNACKLAENKAVLIPGSGVNLNDYPYKPEPEGNIVISFAARLLKDKGVYEYINAARIIKSRESEVQFLLIGKTDPDNPNSVTRAEIDTWRKEGIVEILWHRDDVPDIFSHSNIVCLPSYYGEGLPKVLIEAAACGRPVVTTDHPGCRDAIIDGKTGYLVPVRNCDALAEALEKLIKSQSLRKSMGQAGHELAERKFTIENVVEQHLGIYQQLMNEI
jgi:glycosyltransferase involved in cell wall biosynthesis